MPGKEADDTSSHPGGSGPGQDSTVGSGVRGSPAAPDAWTPLEGPHDPGHRAGTSFGRYKLLEAIGEGGFGEVWKARRDDPEGLVAIKVLKSSVDHEEVLARFEQERNAMALLDHPNVARSLDAGLTDRGRPYFVMEYVAGVPINAYCDRKRLGLGARLDLFTQVCEGVGHVHTKGLVHRDLKASNILVTEVRVSEDSDPMPLVKVIDFGVAKSITRRLAEATIDTQPGRVIGTLAYMAPEQAGTDRLGIDHRADVFSLGVVLYELLTGDLPIGRKTLESTPAHGLYEMLRHTVRRPASSVIADLGERATPVAAARGETPASLRRRLRSELEWIPARALFIEPARRYPTAQQMADDIRRYLAQEPLDARTRSPSYLYLLRKSVQRHRATVGAVLAMLLLLVAGLAASNHYRLQASHARDEARSTAAELEQVADFQAEQLRDVDAALMGVRLRHGLLARVAAAAESERATPDEARQRVADAERAVAGADLTGLSLELLEENVLDRALEAIDRKFSDQPLVRARLLHTVGATFRRLGLVDAAASPLEEALAIRQRELGDEHRHTLLTMYELAGLHEDRGEFREAESLFRRALQGQERTLGEAHEQTLASMTGLAFVYGDQTRYDEAEGLYRRALRLYEQTLGPEHPSTLACMNNLGGLYRKWGRLDDAESMLGEALVIQRRIVGEDDPDTGRMLTNLAIVHWSQGRTEDAISDGQRAAEILRRTLGDEHPDTLSVYQNLAVAMAVGDRASEALALLRRVLDMRRRILGETHPETLRILANVGVALGNAGRYEEAADAFEEAVEHLRRGADARDPVYQNALLGLAEAHAALDDHDRLREVQKELLDVFLDVARRPGATPSELNDVAWLLNGLDDESQRDPAGAADFARRACRLEESAGGARLWEYLDTLARAQFLSGDLASALQTQRRAVELMPAGSDPEALDRLADYEAAAEADSGDRADPRQGH